MKLSPKAFGLAAGLFWSVGIGLWTLILSLTPLTLGRPWLELMVGTYPWYQISPMGALVGLIIGFFDGFICGAVFAWLYNRFVK